MFSSVAEAILHFAKATPNKFCLADDTQSVTYSEYANLICRYSAVLKEMGINKGDTVVFEACQTVDYLALTHALQLIGGIFVPVEHNCAEQKIVAFCLRAKAKFIVTNKQLESDCATVSYTELLNKAQEAMPLTAEDLPQSEQVCEILFSTGTTGKEKGIVIMNKNDIALALNVINGVEMEEDNIEMIPSPMNHSHGLRRYYANMVMGASVVLLSSVMDVRRFFSNMDNYRVNSLDLVPAALSVLLKLSKDKLSDYKSTLRYIQLGSAPLLENDKQEICRLLPDTRLYNFYGSTESGCTCIYNFNTKVQKVNCIGKPTYSTEVIVVDDNRNPIASSADNIGLIATKGDMNMLEYFEDPEETARAMDQNRIVYSNDMGYVDIDGDVILIGRKGDVINVGGLKVAPDEIENVALTHPNIADCACVPVADSVKGQTPKLFVQLKDGAEFNQIEIRNFLSTKLEPYKIPTLIVTIDKIPRSFNGKILRKNLVDK